MRVLMLAHNVTERGSAIRAVSLARWLARAGHEPTVVSARPRAGLGVNCRRADGVRILEQPDVLPERIRNGGLSPLDVAGRLVHVGRERYDVVHTFEPRPASTVPALLARRRGILYVADWADLWGPQGMAALWPAPQRLTLGKFDGVWQAYTRRIAAGVTVISSDLERRARGLGIPSERIRRVAIGANDDLFRPEPKAAARSRLGVPADALVVAHTGFAPFDEGLLAATFAELARLEPRAHMLMSGGHFRRVREAAARAGAAERVLHVGVVPYDELGSVIACADVAVLPYTSSPHNEARFPNRVGDYLAAGRPVVTNPTGDLGRLVTSERFGITAPEAPEGFARATLELLRRPGLCDAMGRRARELAETTYSWRSAAAELLRFYEELGRVTVAGPRSASIS